MPRRVPELVYDDDVLVRCISRDELNWKGKKFFVGKIFDHEALGFRALNNRYWEVRFGPIVVGWIDSFRYRFHKHMNLRMRRDLGLLDHLA